MPLRIRLQPLVCLFVCFCAGCDSPAGYAPVATDATASVDEASATSADEKWQKVSAQDHSFHALVPFEPDYDENDMESEFGRLRYYGWSCVDAESECSYFIAQFVYPAEVADLDPEHFLDDAVRRAIDVYQGTLISQEKITTNNQPGREFLYEATVGEKDIMARQQLYLAGATLYQTLILSRKNTPPSDEQIRKFQDSFQLTKAE